MDLEQIKFMVSSLQIVDSEEVCGICNDRNIERVMPCPKEPEHAFCQQCIASSWARVSNEQFVCLFCRTDVATSVVTALVAREKRFDQTTEVCSVIEHC